MSGERLLIVDDSPTVCSTVQHQLGNVGYVVDRATSFLELATYLLDHDPHLILLDLRMPGQSGYACAQFIRWNERCTAPILIYSGCDETELVEAKETTGACGYVRKGQAPEILTRAVQEALSAQSRSLSGGLA